jgi:hypothetical protein
MKEIKTPDHKKRNDVDESIEKDDVGFWIEYFRGPIEAAFADSDAKYDLMRFRGIFDGDKYSQQIQSQIDIFGQGENMQLALLRINAASAAFIKKHRFQFGILDTSQHGSNGKISFLLKRKIPKSN